MVTSSISAISAMTLSLKFEINNSLFSSYVRLDSFSKLPILPRDRPYFFESSLTLIRPSFNIYETVALARKQSELRDRQFSAMSIALRVYLLVMTLQRILVLPSNVIAEKRLSPLII